MSTEVVSLRAPAKVNLSLAVHGLRADGQHEVDTLLLALELHDRVSVRAAAGAEVTLELGGPAVRDVPADDTNLAVRAARAVQTLARERGLAPRGLRLGIEKHIPAAAGLGGGSSDAAAAALGSALVLGLDAEDPEIGTALAALGSDCPFFLVARATGAARCRGRGELVAVLPAPELPWCLVLVTPSFGCSTAAVYRAFDTLPVPASRRPAELAELARLPLAEARARLFNQLEPAALRIEPALADFQALLESVEPGAFRLSGSGSSWFGLFADERSAAAALTRLVSAAEARRYALRGRWVVRPRGRGVESLAGKLQFEGRPPACNS